MVNGLLRFKEYFKAFDNNYIIIGGVACDILISESGFVFRATKDFDIVLIVDNITPQFIERFWSFIKQGGYKNREKEKRIYYRFTKPTNSDFPNQIELFSKKPDIFKHIKNSHLIPIPVDKSISSLSAILMDDNYYNYTVNNSIVKDDLRIASIDTLILLKAKAFLDLENRKIKGEIIDSKNIKKHRNDVLKLSILLNESENVQISDSLKQDIVLFLDYLKKQSIDYKNIFKTFGLPITITNEKNIIKRIKSIFKIV